MPRLYAGAFLLFSNDSYCVLGSLYCYRYVCCFRFTAI